MKVISNLIRKFINKKEGYRWGSPVSGILAELKPRKLEKIIRKFKNVIVHWFKYVDDIFVII